MDPRDDEDSRWLAARLPPTPGPLDPLVRRTVAGAVERARHRRVTGASWAWLAIPVAAVLAVGTWRSNVPVTPVVVVELSDEEEAGLDPLMEEGLELAEWMAPGLTEGDLGLDELSDEQLDGLSRELKGWPGSAT